MLELLCTLLKKTTNHSSDEYNKILDVFPALLNYVNKSEDMFLLLHGTSALRTFIHIGHKDILKRSSAKDIIETAKKLLQPTTNE